MRVANRLQKDVMLAGFLFLAVLNLSIPFSSATENYDLRLVVGPNSITTEGKAITGSINSFLAINDAGRIGFTANDTDGSKPFYYNPVGGVSPVTSSGGPTVNYAGATISNFGPAPLTDVPWIATRRMSGSSFQIQRYSAVGSILDSIGASPGSFTSASGFLDINDAGLVTFPALVTISGVLRAALVAGDGSSLVRLATYPDTTPVLRPAISSAASRVVVRDDLTNAIRVWTYPTPNVSELIAGPPEFSSLGAYPGISQDGTVVAFAGTDAISSGIFVSFPGSPRTTVAVARVGEPVNYLGCDDPAAYGTPQMCMSPTTTFDLFDLNQRVGIVQVAEDESQVKTYRIVFVATQRATYPSFALTRALFSTSIRYLPGVLGLATPVACESRIVAKVGDTVSDGVSNYAIDDISSRDPLNANGDIAFHVTIGGNNGIVVAKPRPYIDCMPNFKQGGLAEWHGDPYGPPPASTMEEGGCVLTNCVNMINYFGRPFGQQTTPPLLNNWMSTHDGYNGRLVKAEACARYLRGLTIPGCLASEFDYSLYPDFGPMSPLNSLLNQENVVMARVNHTPPGSSDPGGVHTVTVTGQEIRGGIETFQIHDPGKFQYGTGRDDWDHLNGQYVNSPVYYHVFTLNQSCNKRHLSFFGPGLFDFVVIDPAGRRSGFDPMINQTYDEIPLGHYFHEVDELQDGSNVLEFVGVSFSTTNPMSGTYHVQLIGTGSAAAGVLSTQVTLQTSAVDDSDGSNTRMDQPSIDAGTVQVFDVNVDNSSASNLGTTAGASCMKASGIPSLQVNAVSASWTVAANASTYDLVRGNLNLLRASGGDFSAAMENCTAGQTSQIQASLTEVPAVGQARFYLVRARDCSGASTYDEGSTSLIGPRDGSIRNAPLSNRCAE